MSRLDSFLRRLTAQHACLADAARRVAAVPGPVFELGLGTGRSYDHLRHLFPDRDIFVFEHKISEDAAGMVPMSRLVVGDMRETLGTVRIAGPAALVHADIGSGDDSVDAVLAACLGDILPGLMANGGVVLADRLLPGALEPLPLPEDVAPGRYFMFVNGV